MIYLIRHGQASFGAEDYDQLSAVGFEQALRVGKCFNERGLSFDAVYRGTLRRHQQTLDTCFEGCPLPEIKVDPGLNELDHRMILAHSRPEWSESDWAQFMAKAEDPKKAFQAEFKKAFLRWLSGEYDDEYEETWAAFCARSYESLRRISQSSGPVAVFTSGGPIAVMIGRILELPDHKIARLAWRIANASISSLEFRGNQFNLISFNEVGHVQIADFPHLFTYR